MTYDKDIAQKYADKGEGSYLLEINIPDDVSISRHENYSSFHKEKEVLVPSGSILQLKSKSTNKDELTTLSMKLIKSNMDTLLY